MHFLSSQLCTTLQHKVSKNTLRFVVAMWKGWRSEYFSKGIEYVFKFHQVCKAMDSETHLEVLEEPEEPGPLEAWRGAGWGIGAGPWSRAVGCPACSEGGPASTGSETPWESGGRMERHRAMNRWNRLKIKYWTKANGAHRFFHHCSC